MPGKTTDTISTSVIQRSPLTICYDALALMAAFASRTTRPSAPSAALRSVGAIGPLPDQMPADGEAQRRRPTSLARRRARPPSRISGEARRRTPAVELVAACGRPESRLTDATQHSAPVTDTVDDFCSSLSIGRTTFCKLVREKRIRLETSKIPTNNGA